MDNSSLRLEVDERRESVPETILNENMGQSSIVNVPHMTKKVGQKDNPVLVKKLTKQVTKWLGTWNITNSSCCMDPFNVRACVTPSRAEACLKIHREKGTWVTSSLMFGDTYCIGWLEWLTWEFKRKMLLGCIAGRAQPPSTWVCLEAWVFAFALC